MVSTTAFETEASLSFSGSFSITKCLCRPNRMINRFNRTVIVWRAFNRQRWKATINIAGSSSSACLVFETLFVTTQFANKQLRKRRYEAPHTGLTIRRVFAIALLLWHPLITESLIIIVLMGVLLGEDLLHADEAFDLRTINLDAFDRFSAQTLMEWFRWWLSFNIFLIVTFHPLSLSLSVLI